MEADQALLYICPSHSLKEKMAKFLYETSMLFIICVFLFTKTCNGRPFASRTTTSSRKLIDNGRGLTPPMGWSSWNHFACNINEDLIKQTAQAMVTTGLANLGYKYINLDDCWGELGRNSLQHVLVANPVKFPSGMAALGNYIHGLGLKFGIYSSAGNYTCSGTMPGSLGHEQADANTFASWGVDYLKYDNCYNDNIHPKIRYQAMSDALQNTGRPIFYSICEWGDQQPALWAVEFGNSWRTTDDITDDWESIVCIADMNDVYAEHAGPGAWNDPDMLEVGNGGMSYDEYVVHFSIWAISKAPLIIGCDSRNMTNDTLSILSNAEVIAVNQDPLGIQARQVRNYGQRDVWAGPLSGGRTVVLFVNKKYSTEEMTAFWSDIGVSANNAVQVRDLWLHEVLNPTMTGNLTVTLPGHSCKMFILTPTS